jgi:hypothetical protein
MTTTQTLSPSSNPFGSMELATPEVGPYGSMELVKTTPTLEVFELYPNNKAAQIRYLHSKGYNEKAILVIMREKYGSGFLYQHVYNNTHRQLKK